LPLPDRAWLAFRLETAYGASDAEMPVEDLLGYLRWCRALRHDRRSPIRRCTPPAR
jgi:hypothetical protein